MNISTRGSLNGEAGDLTFTVGGMDCGSCAAKIETALSRLPGVADIEVSVARERLNLSLAEDKTSVAKIEDTLRKLGFKPALLPQEKAPREKIAAEPHDHSSCGGHHPAETTPSVEQNNAVTFSVGGMDCGSCAAKIETALGRLPGVADVKVSVARERLNFRSPRTQPRPQKSRIRCASSASNPPCCRKTNRREARWKIAGTTMGPATVIMIIQAMITRAMTIPGTIMQTMTTPIAAVTTMITPGIRMKRRSPRQ